MGQVPQFVLDCRVFVIVMCTQYSSRDEMGAYFLLIIPNTKCVWPYNYA